MAQKFYFVIKPTVAVSVKSFTLCGAHVAESLMKLKILIVLYALSVSAPVVFAADDVLPDFEPFRDAIIKRWPDAVDIAVEVNDADVAPDAIIDDVPTDPDLKLPPIEKPPDGNDAAQQNETENVGGLLVTFKTGGHDIEVVFDTEAKVQFVYEDIPDNLVPGCVKCAALNSVAGEILFIEKSTDETLLIPVVSYAVGIDSKVVYISPTGKVISVEDVPDDGSPDIAETMNDDM
jgi:hypothetical protein